MDIFSSTAGHKSIMKIERIEEYPAYSHIHVSLPITGITLFARHDLTTTVTSRN